MSYFNPFNFCGFRLLSQATYRKKKDGTKQCLQVFHDATHLGFNEVRFNLLFIEMASTPNRNSSQTILNKITRIAFSILPAKIHKQVFYSRQLIWLGIGPGCN
jgi:hypothetical protein